MAQEITIVGAGLSGLVAGITLARQGKPVRILEANPSIGGEHSYADSTYLDPEKIKEVLGVDVTPALDPWPVTRIWAYGMKREVKQPVGVKAFTVERGRGIHSLENVLYRQAKKAGVQVELGRRLTGSEIRQLPSGSILATGLDTATFQALGIAHRPFMAHMATGKGSPDRPGVIVYFDSFCREFGYYFQAREAAGSLVFNITKPLSRKQKRQFKHRLSQNDGVEFEGWNDHLGAFAAWPMANLKNRRLFWEDKILAGTLSGMVSPILLFGVHGALVSGKIAALASTDPKRAQKAFKKAASNRYFIPQFAFRKLRETAPHFILKPLVQAMVATYHPRFFPWLMVFSMRPPGWPLKEF